MIRVKICGITNAEDARVAVEAGADALGFIFVEGTPRYIAPAAAAEIIAGLPPFVTPVGVFWDHAAGHIKAVAEECRLGALQFHGDEPPEALAGFTLPVIKTIKVGGPADLDGLERYRVAAFLLDSPDRWSDGSPFPGSSPGACRSVVQSLCRASCRRTMSPAPTPWRDPGAWTSIQAS